MLVKPASRPEAYIGNDCYELRPNGALVASSADVEEDVSLGVNTIIRPRAIIEDSILGDSVIVESGARVDHSTIEDEATVRESAQVVKSRVARGGTVGKSACLEHSSMQTLSSLGEGSSVRGSRLDIKTRVGKSSQLNNVVIDHNGSIETRGEPIDTLRPVVIGDFVTASNVLIRNGVKIEDGVTIAQKKGKTTVLPAEVKVAEGSYIKGGRKFKPGLVIVPRGSKKAHVRPGKHLTSAGKPKIKKDNRRSRR